MSVHQNNTAFLLSQSMLFASKINYYAQYIAIAFIVTEEIIINVLTSLWAIHLIIKLVKNSQTHKLEASLTFGTEFKKLEEKYKILRNKCCIGTLFL